MEKGGDVPPKCGFSRAMACSLDSRGSTSGPKEPSPCAENTEAVAPAPHGPPKGG